MDTVEHVKFILGVGMPIVIVLMIIAWAFNRF